MGSKHHVQVQNSKDTQSTYLVATNRGEALRILSLAPGVITGHGRPLKIKLTYGPRVHAGRLTMADPTISIPHTCLFSAQFNKDSKAARSPVHGDVFMREHCEHSNACPGKAPSGTQACHTPLRRSTLAAYLPGARPAGLRENDPMMASAHVPTRPAPASPACPIPARGRKENR